MFLSRNLHPFHLNHALERGNLRHDLVELQIGGDQQADGDFVRAAAAVFSNVERSQGDFESADYLHYGGEYGLIALRGDAQRGHAAAADHLRVPMQPHAARIRCDGIRSRLPQQSRRRDQIPRRNAEAQHPAHGRHFRVVGPFQLRD